MSDSPPRVVCFGELLMRLDAPPPLRIVQSPSLDVSFTGGEANVAVALAHWGIPTSMASVVPEHDLGTACLNHLRRYGVDVTHCLRSNERLGQLFVETGSEQRSSRVIYDRDSTGFRALKPGDIDWSRFLNGVQLLHFTGTALVSATARELLLSGLKEAKSRKITISFDVSYREKLWSPEEAGKAFREIIPFVDIFIGSRMDANVFFGIDEAIEDGIEEFAKACPSLKWIVFSDRRTDSTSRNYYAASIWDGNEVSSSGPYLVSDIDRIGTGDALAAGVVRGYLLNQSASQSIEFATAAAALKHTIRGDFALMSVTEVEALSRGDSARLRR